jgi:hypothetical protein
MNSVIRSVRVGPAPALACRRRRWLVLMPSPLTTAATVPRVEPLARPVPPRASGFSVTPCARTRYVFAKWVVGLSLTPGAPVRADATIRRGAYLGRFRCPELTFGTTMT